VLDACRELDVALVAYFPLASGKLAGAAKMEDAVFHVVMKTVQEVADGRGVEPGEVALNWLLAKDERIIPIPGCTKLDHARANLRALDWTLSEDEFASLDTVSGGAPPPLPDG
jgi:aryl-alcohol dehydrogenase-like predicted oxidoreductase